MDNIIQLMPSRGDLVAVYRNEKPVDGKRVFTCRVEMWGLTDTSQVLPLVLDHDCGTLHPATTTSNFVGVCSATDDAYEFFKEVVDDMLWESVVRGGL